MQWSLNRKSSPPLSLAVKKSVRGEFIHVKIMRIKKEHSYDLPHLWKSLIVFIIKKGNAHSVTELKHCLIHV